MTGTPQSAASEHAPFALIEEDTIDRSTLLFVGEVSIKEGGLTLNCSYETALSLAKSEALKMGGNGMVLTEHRTPDLWSTCHRITAEVFIFPDPTIYETHIVWTPDRKLRIADFKGATAQRPAQAATYSSIGYSYLGKPAFPKRYTVTADTYFDCRASYFKTGRQDSMVLAHEQVHFDVAELYRRKFLARVDSARLSVVAFAAQQQELYTEAIQELAIKQDAYDTQTYSDPSALADWQAWIAGQLKHYDTYAGRELRVDIRENKPR